MSAQPFFIKKNKLFHQARDRLTRNARTRLLILTEFIFFVSVLGNISDVLLIMRNIMINRFVA